MNFKPAYIYQYNLVILSLYLSKLLLIIEISMDSNKLAKYNVRSIYNNNIGSLTNANLNFLANNNKSSGMVIRSPIMRNPSINQNAVAKDKMYNAHPYPACSAQLPIKSKLQNNLSIKPSSGYEKQIDYRFETQQQIQTEKQCKKVTTYANHQKKNNSFSISSQDASMSISRDSRGLKFNNRPLFKNYDSSQLSKIKNNNLSKKDPEIENSSNAKNQRLDIYKKSKKLQFYHCDSLAIRPSCSYNQEMQLSFKSEQISNKLKLQSNVINAEQSHKILEDQSPIKQQPQNQLPIQYQSKCNFGDFKGNSNTNLFYTKKSINLDCYFSVPSQQRNFEQRQNQKCKKLNESIHNLRPSRVRNKKPIFRQDSGSALTTQTISVGNNIKIQNMGAKQQHKLPHALMPYYPEQYAKGIIQSSKQENGQLNPRMMKKIREIQDNNQFHIVVEFDEVTQCCF